MAETPAAPSEKSENPPEPTGWLTTFTIVLGVIVTVIALSFAADLSILRENGIAKEQALPLVLAAAFLIIFLRIPADGGKPRAKAPWYDVILALVGAAACLYFAYIYYDLINDFFYNRDKAFWIGIVIIPLIVECLRRTAGWSLVVVLLCFLVYGLTGHLVPGQLQGQEKDFFRLVAYLTGDNIALFGLPLNIVTYVVVLFIFMGQLLLKTGASEWFTDLASAMLGRSRGGSAKIAVVASGLFGSISGSAVSNVASTGVITIPLMRQGGYEAQTAGAFEAVASTGGQIMPPIMGAAAFLMAEFLEVEYTEIILAALIPAVLYYFAAFVQADLEAARLKIAPIPEDMIPPFLRVLKEGWFFVVPYAVLIVALFRFNMPPDAAALWACVSLPIVGWIFGYKGRRMTLRDLGRSIAEAGRTSVDIIIIGAMAGLIIGVVETTGLGSALTIVLLQVGEGSLLLLLILTAGISIILGMGMPTTAIYVLLALMVAPPLIRLGIDPMAAHLFVLYYGLMSMITPPVAIAAFTGAKIAGASPMGTAVTACRLGWVAYIIPFVFVFETELLMKGSIIDVLLAAGFTFAGVWLVSAGMLGYLFQRLSPLMRAAFIVGGLLMIVPTSFIPNGFLVHVVGAALSIALVFREYSARKRDAAPAAAE